MSTTTVQTRTAPTILVIEDYSDTRRFLSVLLRGKGYNVVEAEDGMDGYLKATSTIPDLIIMDLALPALDGVEAARRIHETTNLSEVPIIALSAYLTADLQDEVLATGFVEMFAKPFDLASLIECIETTLKS